MDVTGRIISAGVDWQTGEMQLTLGVNEKRVITEQLDGLANCEKLSIKVTKYREKRSLDANGLLWKCLGDIAGALGMDKWEVYLKMLKRYGKYTYIVVKENAVEAVKAQWRECEVLGEIEVNGQKAIQMLCYFGSSTYNTKEFSVLLDGVISEMKEMGLPTPMSEEMRVALEKWEEKR